MTLPSHVTVYEPVPRARQPCSQRRTSPPASRMPTRTPQASAGLYDTAAVSAWASPLGLNVSGAAAARVRRGAVVSTVMVRVAPAVSPAADVAVSSRA